MICPHCNTSLKRKERGGSRCGKCRRPFAFDPKDNPLKLHDVLVRKLVDKLSDGGKLRFSTTQFYYAAVRKTVREASGAGISVVAVVVLLGVLACGGLGVVQGIQEGQLEGVAIYMIPVLAVVVGVPLWIYHRRWRPIEPKVRRANFQADVLRRWLGVYHSDPPGLVEDAGYLRPVVPPEPTLAVLSPDKGVLVCLAANGVPQRLGVALVSRPADLPAGVPVLLMHDASAIGCLLAAQLRVAQPGRRVIDAGLRPRHVMSAKGALMLRAAPVKEPQLAVLRATGEFTEKELAWLARGWWSPVGALRPAVLIAKVEATVSRALAGDSARREAEKVGFMTWPAG